MVKDDKDVVEVVFKVVAVDVVVSFVTKVASLLSEELDEVPPLLG